MNRLETASILLSLTDRLKEHGSWAGETHVQKAAYILKTVLGVPLDFDFILYKHGPFSFDLRSELGSLRAEGLMAWDIQGRPYGPSLKAGPLGEALKTQFSYAPQEYQNQIDFVALKLGGKDVKALERFATAIFVTLERETSRSDRVAWIHRIKPHVSLPQAETAVQEADAFLVEVQAMGALPASRCLAHSC
ncbi:MAG: hypothetical protein ABSB35_11920 [Bryobacteraceae bacterium]|jgi:hypothetical protein